MKFHRDRTISVAVFVTAVVVAILLQAGAQPDSYAEHHGWVSLVGGIIAAVVVGAVLSFITYEDR